MTPSGSLIYLDTSVITAFLKKEQRAQAEMDGYRYCFERLGRGEIRAITSVITRGEIVDSKFPDGTYDRFRDSFARRRNFQLVGDDIKVQERVQRLRGQYRLDLPDATHLATALLYDAVFLYTLDGDDLLVLDGKIPGSTLCICKPHPPSQRYLPL
jgi:predicted nucleic acid-binding protein